MYGDSTTTLPKQMLHLLQNYLTYAYLYEHDYNSYMELGLTCNVIRTDSKEITWRWTTLDLPYFPNFGFKDFSYNFICFLFKIQLVNLTRRPGRKGPDKETNNFSFVGMWAQGASLKFYP